MTGRGATAREDIATLRTIGEVAEQLDLPQHVLRFWETRFKEIDPVKRAGGRRYYRPRDIELVEAIRRLLYREGYTIKGVQRILKEQGVDAVINDVRRRNGADRESVPPPPSPPVAPPESVRLEPTLGQGSLDLPEPDAPPAPIPETPPAAPPPPPVEPPLESPFRAEPASHAPATPPIASAPPALRPAAPVIVTRRLDQEQTSILRRALAEIEECKRLLNLTRR